MMVNHLFLKNNYLLNKLTKSFPFSLTVVLNQRMVCQSCFEMLENGLQMQYQSADAIANY
jgi:hypothetical protein